MNQHLEKSIRERIAGNVRRFDDASLRGKTVHQSIYGVDVIGVSFTDGTWCACSAELDCDEPQLNMIQSKFARICLSDIRVLDIITEDEFAAAQAREKDAQLAFKRKQLEQLKAELGEGECD